jgi:hypothetical protein
MLAAHLGLTHCPRVQAAGVTVVTASFHCSWSKCCEGREHLCSHYEGLPKCGAPPPRGRCWYFGEARVVCVRDIFILNEIWAQGKIYISVGTFIIIGSTALRGPWSSSEGSSSKASSNCFFRFRDKSLFQGGVVSPTPNPRLSWRADVFCQGCLP